VTDAFAARQQLQQAEVAQLQQRMVDIQQALKTREQVRQEIIDKRVKYLLNPDWQWDGNAKPQPAGATTTANNKTIMPNTKWANESSSDKDFPELTRLPNGDLGRQSPDDVIWRVLGVRVAPATHYSDQRHLYRGALLVTAVRPESAAQNIRAGDLIIGLHKWVTTSKQELALALLQPIAKNLFVIEPTGRQTTEKTVVHLLRDERLISAPVVLKTWTYEPNGRGYVWSREGDDLAASLGLTLKRLTWDDATDLKYVGANQITAIKPDSPAKQLEVDDIIVSIQFGGPRATFRIVRGTELMAVTVETPVVSRSGTARPAEAPKPILPGAASGNPSSDD